MFGLFKPALPVSDEDRAWVDHSFVRLGVLLGAERMLKARVFLPTPQDFPDRYDGSDDALKAMFARVAHGLQVDPEGVVVDMFDDATETTRSLVPFGSSAGAGPGGLYLHAPTEKAHIAVRRSQLKDPLSLVAVLAHELCHVILLRPGLIERDAADMEPLNDLATVFLGFGVFNANAAFQFRQFTETGRQGWSTSRLGYLSEEVFAYALARFAFERAETKPAWTKHLSGNIAPHFRKSLTWLQANAQTPG